MRILVWSELFWPYLGGAELFASQLMLSLQSRGYEFTVVTSHDSIDLPDEETYRGIRVYRFPFRTALLPARIDELVSLLQRVARLSRDLSPEVVHLNGVTPSAFFCLRAVRACGTPLLVRLNREMVPAHSRPGGTLLAHVLESAAWVTSVSEAVLGQARRLVPGVEERSSVIYNGAPAPEKEPPAAPSHSPRILCLGRLVPVKGFDLAVEAFAAVLRRWPAARMTIAGDGPERRALEQRVAALGISAAVDFVGWIAPEGVPGLITQATLVTVPSREEGLPAIAIQAAAAGRPVVGTRAGGLPEIVVHGETGLLVEHDAGALAGAIARLLAENEEATKMGAAAWRRARAFFGPERCWNEYEALYELLARTPTQHRGDMVR